VKEADTLPGEILDVETRRHGDEDAQQVRPDDDADQ
jgi:hypothetical protein